MTWSYDINLATNRDRIRFLLQDTDTNNQLLQDEEITWALTVWTNVFSAAAKLAHVLGSRFAGKADSKTVGDLSLSYSATSERFFRLAEELETLALSATGGMAPLPYAGGISQADMETSATDDNRHLFRIGLHDNEQPLDGDDLTPGWVE